MSDLATDTAPAAKGIVISPSATRRIVAMMKQYNAPLAGLRLAVKGGGCSGLSYVLEWAEQPKEKDKIFERDGARVFVDSKSLLFLNGSEVVYEESFMSSAFKLNNPNVKGTCGCGDSFSV